ncbi:MAG: discoidin domain-containing protein [Ignavibacteriales bacterium]|nr:MAG: discoidin domain-containing protein [Ignavibacteriales bacterium]
MKNNLLLVVVMALLIPFASYSQTGYLARLANGVIVNSNTYEFDVLLRSTGSNFQLTSYQGAFTISQNFTKGGTITFSYINSTSSFSSIPPSVAIGSNTIDGSLELAFASMPGNETITSSEVRIGRFRLTNTTEFGYCSPAINWDFTGASSTILTGTGFTNITNQLNHVDLDIFAGLIKYNAMDVIASATTDPNTAPEKANDGLGYYDGDPNARWASEPMPEWIQFDLGTSREICLARLSFYNFQSGRIYEFTLQSSIDGNSWSPILNNIFSVEEEWTVVQFAQTTARYLRIIFNGNNQNTWANLWEGEMWGPDGVFPVELSSFTAQLLHNKVQLDWSTSTETNNYGFEIQRKNSVDENSDWVKIGFVEGAGNSNSLKVYSFVDNTLLPGTSYYRLKQVDTDGKFSYTEEIEIVNDIPLSFELNQNYPNPFNPSTIIKFSLPQDIVVKLSVYNILGELVQTLVDQQMKAGYHEITFNASGLSSGHYFYRIETDQYVEIKKMVLIK